METFTHAGMTFDVSDFGPPGGPLVVLAHGFPEDRHSWDELGESLGSAGWRAVAPDLRGYSPGARPLDRSSYRMDLLADDVLALADALGASTFRMVGHDWGAALAWYLGSRHPRRVASLAALSVPHPQAFLDAMARSSQPLRSWYMAFFQLPELPERLLAAGGGKAFEALLRRDGLDAASARRYAKRAAEGQMTGPLNWYRATPLWGRRRLGPVSVPSLYIWGKRDRYVSREAAERCGRYVSGPYRFVVLEATHWLPEMHAGEVGRLLLEHFGEPPAGRAPDAAEGARS